VTNTERKGNFQRGASFGEKYEHTRNIVVADIEGDGDLDILITNRSTENEICLNDGTGNFTESKGFGAKDDSTIDVEIADMDGDSDNDLILANRDDQPNFVYLNDGNLNFTEKIQYGTGKDITRSVAISDIDKDGHLDIVTANIGEPNVIYFGSEHKSYERKIVFDSSTDQSSRIYFF